jgi:hypothetical protein
MEKEIQYLKRTVSEKEAASIYPYSRSWFQRARWAGNSPPYLKVRGRVMYPLDELDKWFTSYGLRTSTSAAPVKKGAENV